MTFLHNVLHGLQRKVGEVSLATMQELSELGFFELSVMLEDASQR